MTEIIKRKVETISVVCVPADEFDAANKTAVVFSKLGIKLVVFLSQWKMNQWLADLMGLEGLKVNRLA